MSLTPEQLAKIQQKESTLPDAEQGTGLHGSQHLYLWYDLYLHHPWNDVVIPEIPAPSGMA